MHAMEKPHKMMMAIRLETQLSRICTRRHRRAVWVGGVESNHHVCMRVVRAGAMHSGNTRALWGGWAHRADYAFTARNPALQLGSKG